MKAKFILLIGILFCNAISFGQAPKAQTNYHPQVLVKKMPSQTVPAKSAPPPAPTDLQKAVVNIVVGNDGKDYNTYFNIYINDGNDRRASYFGEIMNGIMRPRGEGEYFTGDNETLLLTLNAAVPTGEWKTAAGAYDFSKDHRKITSSYFSAHSSQLRGKPK